MFVNSFYNFKINIIVLLHYGDCFKFSVFCNKIGLVGIGTFIDKSNKDFLCDVGNFVFFHKEFLSGHRAVPSKYADIKLFCKFPLTRLSSSAIISGNGIRTPETNSGEPLVRGSNSARIKMVKYYLYSLMAGMELAARRFACTIRQGSNIPAFFIALRTALKNGKPITNRRQSCHVQPTQSREKHSQSKNSSRLPLRATSARETPCIISDTGRGTTRCSNRTCRGSTSKDLSIFSTKIKPLYGKGVAMSDRERFYLEAGFYAAVLVMMGIIGIVG